MKSIMKLLSPLMISLLVIFVVGCTAGSTSSSGDAIIEAKEAIELLNKDKIIMVATESEDKGLYDKEHVKGAIKINISELVINTPVKNLLPPKSQVEEVMMKKGITNDTTILVYDNNKNMDSARVWWTLKVYGHENIKVISGGFDALKKSGAELTTETPKITPSEYIAKEKNTDMIATKDEVKEQLSNGDKNTILIDTRSKEEFSEGTIPSSINLNFVTNNYSDGTYKSLESIRINYLEEGITPKKTAILYCKTSIRAAQSYVALYNAGYRNLKLYDGAWLEWSSDSSLPIKSQSTTGEEVTEVDSSNQDNS